MSSVELLRLKLHRAIIGLVSTRNRSFLRHSRAVLSFNAVSTRNDYWWKELSSTRATNFQQIFPSELNSWTSTPRLGNLVNFVEVSSYVRTRPIKRITRGRTPPPRVEERKDEMDERSDIARKRILITRNSKHFPSEF